MALNNCLIKVNKMPFKLNEMINVPYVLGNFVHCSTPIEEFKIESFNPAMC